MLLVVLGLVSGCAGPQKTSRSVEGARAQAPVSDSVEASRAAPRVDIETRRRLARDDGVLTIAVVADLNGRYGSTSYGENVHRAVAQIVELNPDLTLSAGDMVAGQREGLDYDAMWEAFHTAVSDPLAAAGIPFAISPGNHDASGYSAFANERERYAAAWADRRPDVDFIDDAHYPFRYAFEVDNTLFVALDITTSGPISADQRAWLDEILSDNGHLETKIVFGHLPLYQFAHKKHRDILDDEALENLLNEHGVDVFVSGHHQAYYPGHRGNLRLVGTGCLGGGVRKLAGSEQRSVRTVVVIEIDDFGVRSIEALEGPEFTTLVDRASLPEEIVGRRPAQRILRDDIGDTPWVATRERKIAAARAVAQAHIPDPVTGPAAEAAPKAASRTAEIASTTAPSGRLEEEAPEQAPPPAHTAVAVPGSSTPRDAGDHAISEAALGRSLAPTLIDDRRASGVAAGDDGNEDEMPEPILRVLERRPRNAVQAHPDDAANRSRRSRTTARAE